MTEKNVFTEMSGDFKGNDQFQKDGSDYYNPQAFSALVRARRSIRKFTAEVIPDDVVNEILDLGLLAPNSSNLQAWEFYRIKSPDLKKKIAYACFSQNAAATASELIVCVARRDSWRKHCQQMLEYFKTLPVETPKAVKLYYGKLAPFVYTVGFLNVLTPFKWFFNTLVGLFKVVPREPISSFGMNEWAVKSTALACENIMLGFRAHGYDTCPMEGFDSCRVKKILNLPRKAKVVMIIGAGKREEGGVYGPRIRFPREQFIHTV